MALTEKRVSAKEEVKVEKESSPERSSQVLNGTRFTIYLCLPRKLGRGKGPGQKRLRIPEIGSPNPEAPLT